MASVETGQLVPRDVKSSKFQVIKDVLGRLP